MLRAIIFDFDGIIVDTEPLHYRAFVQTVRPLGIDFDYARYKEEYIGYDDRDGFRAICAEHRVDLDDERLSRLIAEKASAFEAIVNGGVAAMEGAVDMIERAAAEMPVAVCSGALRRDIDLILPKLGAGEVGKRFGVIVSADDVKRSKPDPESYTLASQRLGMHPRDCLAIEDTPAGIASAKAAGVRTLGVATSFPVDRLIEADRTVQSLGGVSLGALHQWFD